MEELMNDQEIHMLGLQALIPWLEGHNFVVDYVQPEKCAVPHVFALSGELLTVIVAAADMYPKKGQVTEADKAAALRAANELGGLCAVASIGLINVDGIAANDKELMGKPLKNGQFKADFKGLEYIQFEG
ncbi:MAG: hypothetical protein SO119_07930 [Phascolarctobacterium sp.]|nr:hypothetical protein [Phascolarctobacterium sp.]